MVTTTVPTTRIDLAGAGITYTPSLVLGIAPMQIAAAATTLHLNMVGPPGDVTALLGRELHHAPAFPIGVWGPPQSDDDRKIPAGDVIDAADGIRLFAEANIPPGLPPIDYHQVETGKRHPLPFVNETGARPSFITAANKLAALLPPGGADDDVFAAGAAWMARAGQGRTALAALRGERTAPPRFGSLTDGLAAKLARDPKVTLPDEQVAKPVDAAVRPPRAIAVLTSKVAVSERPEMRTTVAKANGARATAPPTLETVRASVDLPVPAQLQRVSGTAGAVVDGTIVAAGRPPLTRLATGASAAVAARGAVGDGRERLAGLDTRLAGRRSRAVAGAVAAGEVAVLRMPNAVRDVGEDARPRLAVGGGAARVVALAHGGEVLADATAGADTSGEGLALPRGTERLAVAVAGDSFADAPGLAGWHAGTALAYLGWSTALAAGATVRAEGTSVSGSRQRRTAGWVRGAELVAGTAIVATRFVDPVTIVVVAIDDPVGTDASRGLSLGVTGASRRLGDDGEPLAPRGVVRGNRTFLIYELEPVVGEAVVVSVASQDGWHLAAVLGGGGSASAVAGLLTDRGLDAAMRPVLPGVGGVRTVGWQQPSVSTEQPPRSRGARAPRQTRKKTAAKSSASRTRRGKR